MEESSSPETFEAESVLADWLGRRAEGEAEDFEKLCAENPRIAGALREAFHGHERVAGVLELPAGSGAGRHGPTHELLEALRRTPAPEDRYGEPSEIASGGMGSVLEVWEPLLRRKLAQKVIRTTKRGGRVPERGRGYEQALARFFEEAQVTAQLTHPGVVPVHELGIDADGQVFFTMDRVGGIDLSEAFRRERGGDERWTRTRLVGVLLRVCETMAFAHSRGVIHRDLKPANVMVGDFGEVYVMDWGLARVLGRPAAAEPESDAPEAPLVRSTRRDGSDPESPFLTREGSAPGTPAFMPPEQAKGQLDRLDARTDVYAVGAMLYSILAGRTPYGDIVSTADPARIALAVMKAAPTPLEKLAPDVPPELLAICEKAMARELEERYGDMRAVARDLRAWLEGRVVGAYESGAWAELKKWVSRNRGWAVSIAAAFLAIVGGIGGMLVVEASGRKAVETERDVAKLGGAPPVVDSLLRRVEELVPVTPDLAPAIEKWLLQVAELLGQREFYVAGLAAIGDGVEGTRFEGALLDEDLAPALERMLEQYEDLSAQRVKMEARLTFAESVEERTVTGEEARRRWGEAAAEVARLEVYGGLELTSQLGLLPLRRDPNSGLWEFWHLASGERPDLDPETDRWRVEDGMGIVLVLLPGGEATLGTVALAPDQSNWGEDYVDPTDVADTANERPLTRLKLDPFFISKYELTFAQWRRAFELAPGEGGTLPVVNVPHARCVEGAARLDLRLPTEAQWEYACRAGGVSPWSFGWNSKDYPEYANTEYTERTVPIGSLEPSPWGLHDMHGNVWEWAREPYKQQRGRLSAGEGLPVEAGLSEVGVLRGGSYAGSVLGARSAHRQEYLRINFDADSGLRVSRPVDR